MTRSSQILAFSLATFAIAALLALPALAGTEVILHSFTGAGDGGLPFGSLIVDRAGNLYGTTSSGGAFNGGTVFKLKKSSTGYHEIVLYSFAGGTDGSAPYSSLVFDQAGNLYGTTTAGGSGFGGTVFKLSPSSGGTWTETVLYSFNCCNGDGQQPISGVYLDSSGTIYGTTEWGGTGTNCLGRNPGCGTFFSLTPTASGWTETVLHSFGGPPDGALPWGNLVRDSAGNFYETGLWGGSSDCADGCGSVVELSNVGGTWTSNVIWAPNGLTPLLGENPIGGLIFDSSGNLYGTANISGTNSNGTGGQGAVFELSPSSNGWTATDLYSFSGASVGFDGQYPQSGVVMDRSGNLYGTTERGGSPKCGVTHSGCGTVFELQKSGSSYQEVVLIRFHNSETPQAGVIVDGSGDVYGMTLDGGKFGKGSVFEYIP